MQGGLSLPTNMFLIGTADQYYLVNCCTKREAKRAISLLEGTKQEVMPNIFDEDAVHVESLVLSSLTA